MRPSYAFLGAAILASMLLLIIYGIAALSPINAPVPASSTQDGATATPLDKPTLRFGNPWRGTQDAKVTIFVFGDYLCEPCSQIETSLAQALLDYPHDLKVVWKDMPNSGAHPEAINAAVAARCAGDQGAFWAYHDTLMSQQASINANNYEPFAAQLHLDVDAFGTCFANAVTRPLVERDFEEGQRLQIDSTPYLFINDRRVSGAIDYEQLKGFIEGAITRADRDAVQKTQDAVNAPAPAPSR
jgi:protein-disulfide isomerase